MSLVKLNWKPSPKELRQFGAIFGSGFLLIGLVKYFWIWNWLFERNEKLGLIFIFIGIVGGAIGLTGTKLALPLYWVWIGIAFVLGNIMSRVVITLIYYGLITPMSFVARLLGRDKLQLKKRAVQTYWQDISLPHEPEKYKRQF
jgi:multisubunit Na+/H+ antiporter MnhG subunit